MARGLTTTIVGSLLLGAVGGCGWTWARGPRACASSANGGVTLVRPRCPAAESCLLGQVVAAGTARPLAQAAVFLQLQELEGDAELAASDWIVRLTDDQGVFTVADAAPGRYRLAVYKDDQRMEVRGIELGAPGTTLVPVRMPGP